MADEEFEEILIRRYSEENPELIYYLNEYVSTLKDEYQYPILLGVITIMRLLEYQGQKGDIPQG